VEANEVKVTSITTHCGEKHVSEVGDSLDKVPSPARNDNGRYEGKIAQREQCRVQHLHRFTRSLRIILTRVATIT